jgi:hypothetical protein
MSCFAPENSEFLKESFMLKRAEKNVLYTILATTLIGLTGMRTSFSGERTQKVKQSMEETTNDTRRGVKKAGRAVEDKTCELVNGKMKCAAKRVKNGILNGTDKIEDAVE